jgi:hypothetical protein
MLAHDDMHVSVMIVILTATVIVVADVALDGIGIDIALVVLFADL